MNNTKYSGSFAVRMENGSMIMLPRLRKGDKLLEFSPFFDTREWVVDEVVYEDSEVLGYCLRVPGQYHCEWYDREEMFDLLSVGKFEKPGSSFPMDSSNTSNSLSSIGFSPGDGGTAGAAATAQDITLKVGQNDPVQVSDVSITPDTSIQRKKNLYSDRI